MINHALITDWGEYGEEIEPEIDPDTCPMGIVTPSD